ncbi:MAG: hypothetical protein IPK19_30680 [Chloroflexi bacterium]|nr:hypothetical protein [Chloroflexota bacterium]
MPINVRLLQRWVFLTAVTLAAAACSALTPEDPAATLRAEREGYVAEATQIAANGLAAQTQVVETVAAAQGQLSQIEARNAALLLTLRAAVPATQQIVSDSGVVTPGQVATPAPPGSVGSAGGATQPAPGGNSVAGGTQFVDVATALTVRDSDGCADVIQSAFAADIQRIYVTARAFNITAGTTMRVEWLYLGEMTFTESFTVDVNDDDFCLWFYIEPTETVFSPGSWSVQLYANDQSIAPAATFTIGSADTMTG